jgi:hypothetical protein
MSGYVSCIMSSVCSPGVSPLAGGIYFLQELALFWWLVGVGWGLAGVVVKPVDNPWVSGGGTVNPQVTGLFGLLLDCRACFDTS